MSQEGKCDSQQVSTVLPYVVYTSYALMYRLFKKQNNRKKYFFFVFLIQV